MISKAFQTASQIPGWLPLVLLGLTSVVIVMVGFSALALKCYRKVKQGTVLLLNRPHNVEVHFRGALVLPVLHDAEVMDITMAKVEANCVGRDALVCQDRVRADVEAALFVRVRPEKETILTAAKKYGPQKASTTEHVQELFGSQFRNALEAVCRTRPYAELAEDRESFTELVAAEVGDLKEYQLERVAINAMRPDADAPPTA